MKPRVNVVKISLLVSGVRTCWFSIGTLGGWLVVREHMRFLWRVENLYRLINELREVTKGSVFLLAHNFATFNL